MDINAILKELGVDLTNAEAKRGALEAIEAILTSRQPVDGSAGGIGDLSGGQTNDIEIDPNLIQPSRKNNASTNADIEIEDEEELLDKVQFNDSDDDISSGDDTSDDSDGSDSDNGQSATSDENSTADSAGENSQVDVTGSYEDSNATPEESPNSSSEGGNSSEDKEDNDGNKTLGSSGNDGNNSDGNSDDAENNDEAATASSHENEVAGDGMNDQETDEDEDAELFDDEDLVDDDAQSTYQDKAQQTKLHTRKIKRERTLQAAKNVLAKAKATKAPQSKIHELEAAIAALEALVESAKHIGDISDDEFNRLINRVLDAIDSFGDSGMTYKTAEERETQVKEIKQDIESEQTQSELSAEDIALIRAETQAVKARDKEADKYKPRARNSFKGFQAFIDSLYRAIALQVSTEETRDDSWSALNRRYSNTGILKQGQRIQELPNKKIPVIDFYFDRSGSWSEKETEVGMKAVEKLAALEEEGKIKINLYYFGNFVSTDPDDHGGGTRGWNEIVKNIIATGATNVVIMTDDDMEGVWRGSTALQYTVPGYVWYLWKNGYNAPRLPRDLKGRGGTQQFSFTVN